ncbi:MAG: hypothetical protein MHM6MM_002807 [Cercozoa sp. M6MM]
MRFEEVPQDADIAVLAMACRSPDKPVLEEFEYTLKGSTLGCDEVDIKLSYCGLCHTDYHMMRDDWGVSSFDPAPLVPGHEGVGHVVRVGTNVTSVKVGDTVGVGWIATSCGECSNCIAGNENLCCNGYTGTLLGREGCFASHIRVAQRFAFKIPQALISTNGETDESKLSRVGPLFCAGCTVFQPLKKWMLAQQVSGYRRDLKVGVVGVGGLGHMAVQFANKMGAEVTAVTRSNRREKELLDMGVHKVVISTATTDVDEIAENKGTLDVVICCSPVALDWERYISLVRAGGVFVLCGIPSQEEESFRISYNSIIFRQVTVAGSIVAGSVDTNDMLNFCASQAGCDTLLPNTEVLPLSKANEAIERMLRGEFSGNAFRFVLKVDL